ncbi:MAG: NrfD/PsrC family molybdoenzyme membrane anchor subunit, partial [Candidatus Methylomirabilales bacterium]
DLVSLKAPRFEAVARVGGYLAFPLAAISGVFLTIHLGKPERGMLFPLYFKNYQSWMVIGGWIIGTFMPLTFAYMALWYFRVARGARIAIDVIGIPVAIAMAGYTGFLLSAQGFVPLWSQKFLPAAFVTSGILTGIALAGIATLVATQVSLPLVGPIRLEERDRTDVIRWLTIFLGIFIVVESYEIYNFLGYLAKEAKGGDFVVHVLTQGDLSSWFWGGVVGVALGLPLLLAAASLLTKRPIPALAYSYFGLVLLGGLILRFILVWGGEFKQPLAFPPSKWPFNLY